jgi:hypothetical protein
MTSSNKPAPADTTAPAQTTTGSATPTEVSSPTQTAAARTAAQGGDTGIISPTDAAFSADDLTEIEQADSPYYQLSSRITQLLGEREIVDALGNTERVYAVDKELGEMRRVWDDRNTTTTEARDTPPEGRQTLRERQIRAGSGPAASAPPPQRPAPATATTAAGTTASGEDTTTTPTTSTTSGSTGGKSTPASTPTSGSTTSTSTAATPTTTGGSEAKP